MKKLIWFLFLITAWSINAQAQCSNCPDCVDSTHLNTFQNCGGVQDYSPYCGCDGQWYRNQCSAFWQNGINCSSSTESCCPALDFVLLPNLVLESSLDMRVYLRNGLSGFINIRLIDSFGKLKQSNNVFFNEGSQPLPVQLDVVGLRTGVYYIFVEAQGMTLWQKFVKI